MKGIPNGHPRPRPKKNRSSRVRGGTTATAQRQAIAAARKLLLQKECLRLRVQGLSERQIAERIKEKGVEGIIDPVEKISGSYVNQLLTEALDGILVPDAERRVADLGPRLVARERWQGQRQWQVLVSVRLVPKDGFRNHARSGSDLLRPAHEENPLEAARELGQILGPDEAVVKRRSEQHAGDGKGLQPAQVFDPPNPSSSKYLYIRMGQYDPLAQVFRAGSLARADARQVQDDQAPYPGCDGLLGD